MKGLQRTAQSVASGLRQIAGSLKLMLGTFATFAVGSVFKKIFSGAFEQAAEAAERALSLTNEFAIRMQKQGRDAAAKQTQLLMKYNEELAKTGVLSASVFDAMAQALARFGEGPREIQELEPILGDFLVRTRGIRATAEQAAEMVKALVIAAKSGSAKGIREFGIVLNPDQAALLKALSVNWRVAFNWLLKYAREAKGANAEAARTPIGQIQRMKNAMETLSQSIGETVLPAQADMAQAWEDALPELKPAILEVMTQLGKAMSWVAKQIHNFIEESKQTGALEKSWNDFTQSVIKLSNALWGVDESSRAVQQTFGSWLSDAVAANLRETAEIVSIIADAVKEIRAYTAKEHTFGEAFTAEGWRNSLAGTFVRTMNRLDEMKNRQEPTMANKPGYLVQPYTGPVAPMGYRGVGSSYQTGGIARTPQVATLAEHGPEVIIPLSNIRTWSKLQQENTTTTKEGNKLLTMLVDQMGKLADAMTFALTGRGFGMGGRFTGGGGTFRGVGAGSSFAGGGGGAYSEAAAAAAGIAPRNFPLTAEGLAKLQAEREPFIQQMMRPETMKLVAATLSGEASSAANQATALESLVNRAASYAVGGHPKTIEQLIRGGFYGPYNRGETARRMRAGISPERLAQVQSMIEGMRTQNRLRGMTDQGMINEIKGYKERVGEDYFGFMGIKGERQTAAYQQSKIAAQAGAQAGAQVANAAKIGIPPLLARPMQAGGLVTKPTFAMLGEKGPEVVLPTPTPSALPGPGMQAGQPLFRAAWAMAKMRRAYSYAKALRFGGGGAEGAGLSELTGPYGFAAPFSFAPGGPRSMEFAGEAIGKLAAKELIQPAMQRWASRDTVHFSPNVNISGNADESVVRMMEIKLQDLSKQFMTRFHQAQQQSRRLNYGSGAML